MEEFYRKKYLSPSYTRNSGTDSLQRDKTVAELRKELSECKEMEEKFDDLCLEIVRLQRENKKIESQQSMIEAQYIEKVKNNKAKITLLKQSVLDCRENIEARAKKITLLDQENQRLSSQIAKMQIQLGKTQEQQFSLDQAANTQDMLIKQLASKVADIRSQQSVLREECQKRSQVLEQSYKELKNSQNSLQNNQEKNEELKQKLEELKIQRQLWEKKAMVSQAQLEQVQGELFLRKGQLQNKENQCLQLGKDHEDKDKQRMTVKDEIKKLVLENKQKTQELKKAQNKIVEASRQLQKQQEEETRTGIQEAESKKESKIAREELKNITAVLTQEQEGYSRVIAHMKQSIQQDEKAIQGLMKQANIMENMIV